MKMKGKTLKYFHSSTVHIYNLLRRYSNWSCPTWWKCLQVAPLSISLLAWLPLSPLAHAQNNNPSPLVRSWKTGFLVICKAACLSQYSTVAFCCFAPSSLSSHLSHISSLTVLAMARYSDSAEDLDTTLSFFVGQEMGEPPSFTIYPRKAYLWDIFPSHNKLPALKAHHSWAIYLVQV